MKPMLAAPTDGRDLRYPLLVSPKLDGVRALVMNGVVVSRSLKPIPNEYVQQLFGRLRCDGLDGELVVGHATAEGVFQTTTSGVMSIKGRPNVYYHVFDHYTLSEQPFEQRLARVAERDGRRLVLVPHTLVETEAQLFAQEQLYLEQGYEGLMIRDPSGPYKHGRSTLKQGWLLKLKRFVDGDAFIIGVKELMHNDNAATTNALGYKERSHKKAGMVGKNMLGALTVEDVKTKVIFDIGTGFTQTQREQLWRDRHLLMGDAVKYKYQPVGVKEKPRFPVFLGFRSRLDL